MSHHHEWWWLRGNTRKIKVKKFLFGIFELLGYSKKIWGLTKIGEAIDRMI